MVYVFSPGAFRKSPDCGTSGPLSGQLRKAGPVARVIQLLHQVKKVLLADVGLLGIGEKSIQCRGDEFRAVAGRTRLGVVELFILRGSASEGDGFHAHAGKFRAFSSC